MHIAKGRSIRKSESIESRMIAVGFVPDIAHLFSQLDDMLSYNNYTFTVHTEKPFNEDAGFEYNVSLGQYQSGVVTLKVKDTVGMNYKYYSNGMLDTESKGRTFLFKITLRAEVREDGSVGEARYHVSAQRSYDGYSIVLDEHEYDTFSHMAQHINDLLKPDSGMIGEMGWSDPYWGGTSGIEPSVYEEAPGDIDMVRDYLRSRPALEIYNSMTDGSQRAFKRYIGNVLFENNPAKYEFINFEEDDEWEANALHEMIERFIELFINGGIDIDSLPYMLKTELYALATEYWYSNHRKDYEMLNLSSRKNVRKSKVRKSIRRPIRKSTPKSFNSMVKSQRIKNRM